MKTTSVAIALALIALSAGYAGFVFKPMLAAPQESEIGEVKFDTSDAPINGSQAVGMSRDEFLRYFRERVFFNDGASIEWEYRSGHFKEPRNEKGGWMYCSGAFATKGGRVFTFNRPRVGVIEISDASNQLAFLVLPEFK